MLRRFVGIKKLSPHPIRVFTQGFFKVITETLPLSLKAPKITNFKDN
jgi:hypothetical protein